MKRFWSVPGALAAGLVLAACAVAPGSAQFARDTIASTPPGPTEPMRMLFSPAVATATCTPIPAASATPVPSLTPTPTPFRVAVAPAVFDDHIELWPATESILPSVVFWRGNVEDCQAQLVHTWEAAPDEVVLAGDPYLWVCHHEADVGATSWRELAEMQAGGWSLIAPPECQDLLSEHLPSVRVAVASSGADAVRIAGRDRRVLALAPWSAVTAEARILPFDGRRFEPGDSQSWSIRRLTVQRGAVSPDGLIEHLTVSLNDAPPAVELVGVGDIMLARNVGEKIASEGVRYPFEGAGVADLLREADVAFGNLECVVSNGGVRQSKAYTFRADPATLEGLAWAGFDIVSLANNHTCDYGRDGVIETVRLVDEAGILAIGAGENLERARQPQFVEVGELRLAFLAYNQIGPRWMDATVSRAGSAYMEPAAMVQDVRSAAERADLVIVSCHWGVEHSASTTASQRDLTAKLWDAGACLVLGHHPHVMEAMAVQGHHAVVYSMGNFIFDMGTVGSRDGYATRCLLDETGVKQIELVPYRIEGYRPSLLEGEPQRKALDRVYQLTRQAGGWPE